MEGNTFVHIQPAENYINDYPNEPLLYVFTGQHPKRDNAERVGQTIEEGNGRIGPDGQYIIQRAPNRKENAQRIGSHTLREVRNGQHFNFRIAAAPTPYKPAVSRSAEIVNGHPKIGIKTYFIIEINVDSRHNHTHRPKSGVRMILIPKINEAQERTKPV